MILILMIAVVVSVIAWLAGMFAERNEEHFEGWAVSCMAITILLSVGTHVILSNTYGYTEKASDTSEIAALSNASKLSNRTLFLGVKTIEDEQVYYYMEKMEDGMIMKSINVDYAIINETDDETPNITTYKKTFDNETLSKILGSAGITKTIINVPVGSVDKAFQIDLKDN